MKLPSTLAPMPTQPSEDEAAPAWCDGGGFVDESRLSLLIGTPLSSRTVPAPDDLVLTADENDFAGWMFPARTLSEPNLEEPAKARLAAEPRGAEESLKPLGASSHATRSWWIFSSAGAFFTLLFAFLLLTLAWRPPAIAAGAALPVLFLMEERPPPQAPATTPLVTEIAASAAAAH